MTTLTVLEPNGHKYKKVLVGLVLSQLLVNCVYIYAFIIFTWVYTNML